MGAGLTRGEAKATGQAGARVTLPIERLYPARNPRRHAMADEYLNLQLDTGNGQLGDVKIKLRPDLAPSHVERIKELVGEGFYDGIKFHRVIPGFMAQGGCPQGTGMGGSDKPDLQAEFNDEPHVRGVCSMARTNYPHSANSQFFIVFDDARFLDKQYTVWGQVVEGMENVDALPKGEPPREPGKIVKATVTEG
jgi:cyclophilin family peptidyl-prolyl cis-trans isomerase